MRYHQDERFHRHIFRKSLEVQEIYTVFHNKMLNSYATLGETHDFYELIYVHAGTIRVTLEDRSFCLSKGECYLHPPKEFHQHSVAPKKTGSVCIVTFSSKSEMVQMIAQKVWLLSQMQLEKLADIMRYGSYIFESMVEQEDAFYFVKSPNYPVALEQLFLNTLEILLLEIHLLSTAPVSLTENLTQNLKPSDEMILHIKQYLLDHVTSKITISELCEHFSYGKTSMSQQFKLCTGKTIMEYFNKLKIKEAMLLIEHTKLTMTEIAYRLNFSNASYFSTVFKQYAGMNPSSYKKYVQNEKNWKFI